MKNISQIVICSECGRKFDIGVEGGAYDKRTKHYYCNKCKEVVKKKEELKREERKKERIEQGIPDVQLAPIKKKKTAGIVLFCLGCLFLTATIDGIEDSSSFFTGLFIAALLLTFGCIKIRKSKKELKKLKNNDEEPEHIEQTYISESECEEELEKQFKCPNCGALTKGPTCEYCGHYLTDADCTTGGEIEAIETSSDFFSNPYNNPYGSSNTNWNSMDNRNNTSNKMNIWGEYPPIIDILLILFTSGLWFIYMLYRSNKKR